MATYRKKKSINKTCYTLVGDIYVYSDSILNSEKLMIAYFQIIFKIDFKNKEWSIEKIVIKDSTLSKMQEYQLKILLWVKFHGKNEIGND